METATPECPVDDSPQAATQTALPLGDDAPAESVAQDSQTPPDDPHPVVRLPPTGCPLDEIEREALIQALQMSHWVQTKAAKLLCISPRVMNYKLKTHGLLDAAYEGRHHRSRSRPKPSED